jgi:hypothetical protein
MKSRIAILIVVLGAFAGVIVFKQRVRPASAPAAATSKPVETAAPATKAAAPSILMVIDPREENEEEGCGAIIRIVRAAPRKGWVVTELPPDSPSPLMKQHNVVTQPTVIFFDSTGKESRRFEGEGEKTIEAMRAVIDGAKGQV